MQSKRMGFWFGLAVLLGLGIAQTSESAVVLLVRHQVAEYRAWEQVFNEHRAVRKSYGGSRDLVYQDSQDPTQVTVYMTFPSAAKAEAFFADPSLGQAMGKAGVKPPLPPRRELLREVETLNYVTGTRLSAGNEEQGVVLFIRHSVANFAAWKKVFDEVEGLRRKHGCTGYRLYTAANNPGDVIVYESYPTAQQAEAFFNDPALAEAMGRAGVQPPFPPVHSIRTLSQIKFY
jgi:quinol monooxygenase YgiN